MLGSTAISRSASSWRKKRMRRTGSLSMRILGARSNHSHSSTHLRKIARTNSSVRFVVALLSPCASFASVMRSTRERFMRASGLPPKCACSQRSLVTSSPAVALCDCSFSHRTAASFHRYCGLSDSFETRHSSDFTRS